MDYIEWNYIQAKKQADRLEEQAGRLLSPLQYTDSALAR